MYYEVIRGSQATASEPEALLGSTGDASGEGIFQQGLSDLSRKLNNKWIHLLRSKLSANCIWFDTDHGWRYYFRGQVRDH